VDDVYKYMWTISNICSYLSRKNVFVLMYRDSLHTLKSMAGANFGSLCSLF